MPPLPAQPIESLRSRSTPVTLRVEAGDAGALAATDAVFLPGGRTVVALGEAGARLLSRDGRVIAEFAEPTHRLVVSDNGDRAIALAPRGDVWRLARLDLLSRRAETWCEAKVDAWAESYDGSLWFLGAGEDFYAIDATARRFDALWRVPDVGGRTLAVARLGFVVTFLTGGRGFEEWRYDLPLLRLRARNAVTLFPDDVAVTRPPKLAISPDGVVADATEIHEQITLRLSWAGAVRHTLRLGAEGDVPAPPSILAGIAAAPVVTASGARVRVVDTASARVLIDVELAGARHASARVRDDAVTIADDRGRVLAFELGSGALVRNLRL